MITYIIIAAVVLVIIIALIPKEEEKKDLSYQASFLDETELLSRYNHGYCVNGTRCLTMGESMKHVLITGASGAFKSSGILIPSILRMRGYCSFVINDPSGELLERTSGALLQTGYSVKVLNYNKPSEGYNPLSRVSSLSDIKKVSKLLITAALGSGGKDPFWNASAEHLTTLCIQYILSHTTKEFHTLANTYALASLILSSPEKSDKVFIKAKPAILNEYKTFIAYGSKTLASIVATVRTALSIFSTDEHVALVTSHDSISFEEFRTKKVALFINNSITTMKYHSVTTSLLLDQIFEYIMGGFCDKNAYPVNFLLDEASSLSFNNLQITIANLRKFSCSILQAYQSTSQMVDLYSAPVAKAITENSYTRCYMPGQPLSVALELEALIGKTEYRYEKNMKHVRSLITANEIHELNEALIFCGNHKAIKTPITPYFKQFGLNRLSKISPYIPGNKIPFDTPPLIQF